MYEESSSRVLWEGVKVLLKAFSALLAMGAWLLAALWMLWPLSLAVSSADSVTPAETVYCAPPAWGINEDAARGCQAQRDRAPVRALTAMVIALPATWVWFGLRVKPPHPDAVMATDTKRPQP